MILQTRRPVGAGLQSRHVDFQNGAEQRPRIGVARRRQHIILAAEFDDPAAMHHRDPRRDAIHHRKIVRDEQVRQPEFVAQVEQQVENLGLHRHVQTTGTTRPAAERSLKKKLAERDLFQPGFSGMSADSPFPALVSYWLEDMDLEDRLSRTTRLLYERNMRTLVLPFFKDVTLREISVARSDYFLKQLAKQSYNRARQARVALRLALALAVRHEVLPRNPMDNVSRLRRPVRTPDIFSWEELKAIRAGISAWEHRPIKAGPKPDGQLGQIVEVMRGTSARIGEVLAIRLADLDLDAPIPSVRISGTIVSRKGEPTHRQDHPKTARSVRRVALPAGEKDYEVVAIGYPSATSR